MGWAEWTLVAIGAIVVIFILLYMLALAYAKAMSK